MQATDHEARESGMRIFPLAIAICSAPKFVRIIITPDLTMARKRPSKRWWRYFHLAFP